MTLSHHADAVTIDRLSAGDLVEVFGFLDRDPVVNVYLLALTLRDALAKPHDEYWAARRDGEIVGLLHLGGQSGAVLPLGDDDAVLSSLAEQAWLRLSFLPRRFQVIGPRGAVNVLVQRLAAENLTPRVHRRQLYLALEPARLAPFERLPELAPAGREDYELVHRTGAMLRLEELGEDPRRVDPLAYSKRVEEECRDRYTHVWKDRKGLCFRASVSALTPDAAQVSGVYTPPPRRHRGLARRGLSELCARLLERSRAVCLFVNDFNAPALALYHRIGFVHRADWASAFYERVCA
jgi:ribosomal protein S18 acetylase RimI-like enzyme